MEQDQQADEQLIQSAASSNQANPDWNQNNGQFNYQNQDQLNYQDYDSGLQRETDAPQSPGIPRAVNGTLLTPPSPRRGVKAEPPVAMPAVGHTLEFPRKDNAYKKKESLPFDEIYSNVWKNRPANEKQEKQKKWLVFALAGLAIGVTAFCMDQLEDFLVDHNKQLLLYIIKDYSDPGDSESLRFWLPALSYASICAMLGLLAGLMTTYYGPGAAGSGVAELIGYMNGVNYPDFLGVATQLTKILGVTLAVASRLCIGKEGPLAHIGAIWGAAACYFPGLGLEFLQNDEFKRQIIAAGGSAGVSAAFGAPIGGTLFAYEMSKPTVFWTFDMIWRTFICCSVAVLVLALLQTWASGDAADGFRGSTIKFGNQLTQVKYTNTYQNFLGAVVLGVIGGMLGALFINVNFRMNALRKRLLTTKFVKPLETALWSFATGLVFIAAPYLMYRAERENVCQSYAATDGKVKKADTYAGWCGQGQYDPNASIFWTSEGSIIKNIMNTEVGVTSVNMFIFFCVWYLFTITTYGTNVPAGLFLPGMIIGCALGRTVFAGMNAADLIVHTGKNDEEIQAQFEGLARSYVVLACGAFMAGYTRMTYSLAVILMETSQDIEIFTPMIVTIAISNQVGYFFTRSLYERATRGKQMPIIKDTIPAPCEAIIAANIMATDVVTLQNVDTVQNVLKACLTSHHGFPVLNSRGNVVGLIPKNYALTLIKSRAFYRQDGVVADVDRESFENKSILGDRSLAGGSVLDSAVKYERTAEQTPFQVKRKKTLMQFSNLEDADKYPETPAQLVVPWRAFCRDFWSRDLAVTPEIKAVCQYYENYMIDFRPYLIESPVTVFTTDSLHNCVQLTRNMYLRHLVVINPLDGSLQGIITRQDMFQWLDL